MSTQMFGLTIARRPKVVATLVAFLSVLGGLAFGNAQQSAVDSQQQQIQLVAVQMTLDLNDYWTREAFEAKIRQQMDLVAASIDPSVPTLVVFPEDVGLLLVVQGMRDRLAGIDSIGEAIETVIKAHTMSLLWTRLIRWKSWVPALFLTKNKMIAEAYFETFSAAARDYGVYLVAGSAILPPYRIDNGVVQWQRGPQRHRVHNTSYLFGPDGLVIGKQDKVELIALETEEALNLTPGSLNDLRVFDTPLGRIGIAICLDAFIPEVVDRLAAQGAQILVQPSANPGPWNTWQQEDWLRSSYEKAAVDGRFAYAINPMLTGPLWDVEFFGQSSIVARGADDAGLGYFETGPMPGFIGVADTDDGEELLVVVVPHPDHVE